jgi:SAM-dependent methyltransferase
VPARPPYRRSADGYDGLYAPKKDFRGEVRALLGILRRASAPARGDWLEVASGTGLHVAALPPAFRVEGVDLSAPMLALARKRLPDVPFHEGDMRTFDLGRRFDVVSCLFSSIGYMTTLADLRRAIANLARHTREGGVVVVEPWFSPSTYRAGRVYLDAIAGRTRTARHQVRMIVSERRGRVSVMDAHHLVGTPAGVEHFVERHRMGLFTRAEYEHALRAAGLDPIHDRTGISDRGLYLGFKRPPLTQRPLTRPPRSPARG